MPVTLVEPDVAVRDPAPALSAHGVDPRPQYTLRQLLRSRYYAFWYRLGERLAWSRGTYRERSPGQLDHLNGNVRERIERLQQGFDVRFEEQARPFTALKQYDVSASTGSDSPVESSPSRKE